MCILNFLKYLFIAFVLSFCKFYFAGCFFLLGEVGIGDFIIHIRESRIIRNCVSIRKIYLLVTIFITSIKRSCICNRVSTRLLLFSYISAR